jgi:hypothetical protein
MASEPPAGSTTLTESGNYPTGVYQIATTDPVLGGDGGVSNYQAQQLADRTGNLNTRLNAEVTRAQAAEATKAPIANASLTGLTTVQSLVVSTGSFEHGSTTAAATVYHDYHSSGFGNDYDVRTSATGGTNGSSGRGAYGITAAATQFLPSGNAATNQVLQFFSSGNVGVSDVTMTFSGGSTTPNNGSWVIGAAAGGISGSWNVGGTLAVTGAASASSLALSGSGVAVGSIPNGQAAAFIANMPSGYTNNLLQLSVNGVTMLAVTNGGAIVTPSSLSVGGAATVTGRITGSADMVLAGNAYLNGGFSTTAAGFVGTPADASSTSQVPNTTWVLKALAKGWGLAESQGGAGYVTLPGGVIIQWGTAISQAYGLTTVTLPVAFPNNGWMGLVCEGHASSLWAGSNGQGQPTVHGLQQGPSQTQISIYSMAWTGSAWTGTGGLGFYWLAIGN